MNQVRNSDELIQDMIKIVSSKKYQNIFGTSELKQLASMFYNGAIESARKNWLIANKPSLDHLKDPKSLFDDHHSFMEAYEAWDGSPYHSRSGTNETLVNMGDEDFAHKFKDYLERISHTGIFHIRQEDILVVEKQEIPRSTKILIGVVLMLSIALIFALISKI